MSEYGASVEWSWQGKPKLRKISPGVTLSTANLTRTDLGSIPGLRFSIKSIILLLLCKKTVAADMPVIQMSFCMQNVELWDIKHGTVCSAPCTVNGAARSKKDLLTSLRGQALV
jgi:hypothetical protein